MSSVTAVIDKLRLWCAGGWKTYNMSNLNANNVCLRLHYDQLFITSQTTILESLNLNGNIKGIYKNDVLILITCDSLQQVRKIKFQIKTNVAECLYNLNLHFPLVSYNHITQPQYQAKYRSVEEVLKSAINNKGSKIGKELPPNFKDFVKICFLDPCFPNFVTEVQDVIKKIHNI